jgi:hypothetical protein
MRTILTILITLSFGIRVNAQWDASYRTGYYYNISGQKIVGFIDCRPELGMIYFKTDKDAKKYEKVRIKDISSVIILHGGYVGAETIPVLTEDGKPNKRYLAKFFFASPANRFYYKFLKISYGGTAGLTTLSNVPSSSSNALHSINMVSTSPRGSYNDRVVMCSADSTTYELTKKNYIEVLSKSFADVPELVQQIQNKEYKFKQLYEIIKLYRSKTAYKEN